MAEEEARKLAAANPQDADLAAAAKKAREDYNKCRSK